MPIYRLPKEHIFPDPNDAEPYGLLAVGGDLDPKRIIFAYQSGLFPWFSEGEPIQWWSPNPRFVLFPEKLKIAKSMRPILRKQTFDVSFDKDFRNVIRNCQKMPREGQDGTWITNEMETAYIELHRMGFAHSVEVWQNNELVGGLYGQILGTCFFGESMFAKVSNASKVGFITLVKNLAHHGIEMIDCQVHTPFLESLGAEMIPREEFLERLDICQNKTNPITDLQSDFRTDFDFVINNNI
jgi:leucyl/phenylalanyl-tRNA--protein transferase